MTVPPADPPTGPDEPDEPRDLTTPADPGDLPPTTATGAGFDPMKHLGGAPDGDGASWVPERSAATPEQPAAPGPAPHGDDPFFQPPGSTPGRRVRPWQVVGGLALVFVPLIVWFTSSLTDPDPTPVTAPTVTAPSTSTTTTATPTASSTPPTPPTDSGDTTTVVPRDFPTLPTSPNRPSSTTKPALTAPPSLLPAPTVSITALPPGAKTIRFEAQAAGGEKVEVSLSDATHQRFDYPLQKAPLAFEVPVGSRLSSNDYFSLRVRTPYDSSATRRPDVACRILVDGVVVTSQQGQGYVTCYISPYYDVRRT